MAKAILYKEHASTDSLYDMTRFGGVQVFIRKWPWDLFPQTIYSTGTYAGEYWVWVRHLPMG